MFYLNKICKVAYSNGLQKQNKSALSCIITLGTKRRKEYTTNPTFISIFGLEMSNSEFEKYKH